MKLAEIHLRVSIQENCGLICLTEAWLNRTMNSDLIALEGYNLEHKYHLHGGGGRVEVHHCDYLPVLRRHGLKDPDIEIMWLEIKDRTKAPSIIGVCYRPPNQG